MLLFFRKEGLSPLPKTAIFQPRPGLGDLIWHLPIIRALAKSAPITLITKPSTQADQLLANDPDIAGIVWFDRNPRQGSGRHDGPIGFARLVAALRATQADTCVLLHHGASLAAAMCLAGIPSRQAYGYSAAQRAWLTGGPFLQGDIRFAEAFDQATAYAAALGFNDLPEPAVRVDPASRQRVARYLAGMPSPVLALGIGSHGANRQWGAERFAALATLHHQHTQGATLLLGAAQESALAAQVIANAGAGQIHPVIGWALPDIVALLAEADLFVGNDSGLMNLRAAVGRTAYGLFGASGPLRHSPSIVPIVPPGGPRQGMDAITVQSVADVLPSLRETGRF